MQQAFLDHVGGELLVGILDDFEQNFLDDDLDVLDVVDLECAVVGIRSVKAGGAIR